MSILIGQKLVENAKIHKLKCDISSNFQTMWTFFFWLSQNTVVALALGNCCPCPEALLFNQVEEIARENEGAQKN